MDAKKTKRMKRPNGYGSLQVRGNYYWAVWVYRGERHAVSTKIRVDMVDEKGRPCGRELATKVLEAYTEPFRHKNQADVLALLSLRVSAERDLADKTDVKRKLLTLEMLGDEYKRSTRRNEMTDGHLSACLSVIADFAGFAGKSTLASSITAKQATEWADAKWGEGISPHTFNCKISTMRQVWLALAPKIGSKTNPWDGIKHKKNDAKTRKVLAADEIEAVKATAGDRYGGDVRLLLTIGEYTGMRIGDCSTLKWCDVDFDSNFIRVITQKTGAKVSIPMSPDFRKALLFHKELLDRDYAKAKQTGWKKYWDSRPAKNRKEQEANAVDERYVEYICPRMAERHFRDKTLVVTLISKTFKKAGIATSEKIGRSIRKRPVAGFHSLRHGLASRLAAAGVSERIAMQILGHRSESVHEAYVHLDENAIQDAFARLEGEQPLKKKEAAERLPRCSNVV